MKNSFAARTTRRLVVGEQQGLRALARLTTTYAKSVLVVCLALVVGASLYTVHNLGFVTGRNDLVSPDKRYVQLDEEYSREFVGIDQVVVVVEPRDVEQGKEFVTRLGTILVRDTAHIKEVFYRIDTSSLDGKKLLYLTADDLRDLRDDLGEHRNVVQDLMRAPGVNTLFHAINQEASSGMVDHLVSDFLGLDETAATIETNGDETLKVVFLTALLREMEYALSRDDYRYRSPWAEFFGDATQISDHDYLVSDNRRFVFLMVEPQASGADDFAEYSDAIATIRQAVASLLPEFPDLRAGVTGTRALNNDEALSTQADARIATVVSLVGVTLLYLLFFRKLRHPAVIVTTLLVGLIWTMGFVTLVVGHLTIITVFVAPMLLGLADDFSVHFLARYEEERSHAAGVIPALVAVFERTARGIVAGGVTTALAFSAVMLADFRGVQELGLIAGGGILLCLLATLIFLPALIVVVETFWPWTTRTGQQTLVAGLFSRIGAALDGARWPLLVFGGVLTVGGLAALPTISFDYNLLNLQARGTESVEWEMRILENSERSSRDALATARSPQEAMQKAAAFEALSTVESVESVASLIPSGQEERLALVRSLQPLLGDFPRMLPSPVPTEVEELQRTLDKLKLKIRDRANGEQQTAKTQGELRDARQRLLAVMEQLRTMPRGAAEDAMGRFERELLADFQDKWTLLHDNLAPAGPITLQDIPVQLKSRFVSADGRRFLLQVYPKENVWEREPQERFIRELRQVDPDVTGSPIIGYESIRAMKEGYIEGGMYALIAITVVSFLALRRLSDTLMALLPLGLGALWTAGLMWLFDLQLNLANLVAVPLIIGISLENGIHLVHRFRENPQGDPATLVAGSTGQSVALFSLTTMVGFGSLMVAKYYGIFSMGLLLTLAVGSVLVASLTILPLLLFHPVATQQHAAVDLPYQKDEPLPQRRAQRGA